MRYILIMVLILSALVQADQIKVKSLACTSIDTFEKIPPEVLEDELKLSLFAVANGCRSLSRKDAVTAIGYDPRNEKALFVKILHKKSGETLYVRRKNLQIEQPGKKNQIRF